MMPSARPIGVSERLTAVMLGIGSMVAFDLSWKFLAAAAVLQSLRRMGRPGSLGVPWGGVFLCAFALSRVYLSPEQGKQVWAVGLMSMLSYFVAYILSCDGWVACRLAVMSIVAGATAHALLNASMIVRDYGFVPSTRLFNDVWTGTVWTATGQATLWVPLVGTVPYLLFASKRRSSVILGWVSLGVTLWAAAALASRTLLGLTVLSMLLGATLALRRPGQLSRLTAAMGSATALAAVAYFALPSGFIDTLPLAKRLTSGQADVSEDPRLERWSYYLNNMWGSPNGGRVLQQLVGYAHNMWLDTFDADGVIAFTLLVLFSLAFIAGMVAISTKLPQSMGGVLLLIGVGVTWMTQAATEPLIDLSPYFFAAGCGFAGATAGALRLARQYRRPVSDEASADTTPSLGRVLMAKQSSHPPRAQLGGQ